MISFNRLGASCQCHVTVLLGFSLVMVSALHAANRTWDGSDGTDFETAANWSALPANNLTGDTGVFSGTPTPNQPQLSTSRGIAGLGFSTSTGGWVLGSGSSGNALTLGAGGMTTAGQSSGTNTINANLAIGAAQSWKAGTGGSLLVTGSVSGTGGFPLTINDAGNSGSVILSPAAGNSVSMTGASNSNFFLVVRSGGQLMLGGDGITAPTTAASNTIVNNSTGSTYGAITITGGGAVRVNSGIWNMGDLARNGTSDFFSGNLDVRGGTISFNGARFLAAGTITVSGGILKVANTGSVYSNGGKFALGSTGSGGTATMTVTGGTVNLAQAAVGNTIGTGISAKFIQSGGTVSNGVTIGGGTNGGTVNTLTIGHSGLTSTGSGGTLTYTAVSNLNASYTLTGGTLISAGAIQGTAPASPGTNGSAANPPGAVVNPGTGNIRNFNFNGGTLAVGAFNATQLGYSSSTGLAGGPPSVDPAANSVGIGTLYNNGGTLAPGEVGIAGKTTITGNYVVNSGSLAVDLGGTTQATAFQTGQYDHVSISGSTSLLGNLSVNVLPGFTPSESDTFTILSSAGALSGEFANAPFGSRVVTTNGLGTFVVSRIDNNVTLGAYLPVTAPTVTGTSAPSQISAGDSVVLGITADSLAPLSYEWRRNGVVIPNATSSTLALIGVQASDGGTYEVIASNAAGSVSRTFAVVITTPPSTVQVVMDAGNSQAFSAAPGAISYQWFLDGDAVGSSGGFTYAPAAKAVGTHWLRVVETYADNSIITRSWSVRVRIPIPSSALAYHVSPTGSDASDGSAGAPFATLEKARDTIRALSSGQRAGGVTVFLRGGIHRRTSTFALNSTDSGTAAAPIRYAAYPGEIPVLTGARAITAAQISPLAASEVFRVAPGIDPARIWEIDVTGNPRAATFPNVFNEWWIYNALRASQNGGLLELFHNGERKPLSRYPNIDPSDDTLTPNLTMNGVAAGAANDGSGYLNGPGTYTDSDGVESIVGGAFQFNPADASRIARWQTALTRGGVWLAGYWRVPWQLNAAKVGLMDTGSKQVIAFASGASVSNGIGWKYSRPIGNKNEPYWAINLLEELDQTGEWCVDFSRRKIYFLSDPADAPSDGAIELSDLGTPLVQINGASDVCLQGLVFRRQLGHAVQIIGGARNLVLGCSFSQTGNFAVDINGGTGHGVVSCNLEKLASGGVILRGGAETPAPVNSDQFVVNNKFRGFGEVVRVYQGAIDSGYGGPIGTSKQVSVGTRIAHNDIRTAPHGAILWGSYNQAIEYNDVSDYCRISDDFGGIYRYGPNYLSASVIRYNHVHHSRLGDGIYNDFDHLEVAMYGNVTNLRTPTTAGRGYGFWTNTNTALGGAVPGVPMALNLFNNISVNSRGNYSLHSSTGGVIRNNLSYGRIAADFNWYRITSDTATQTNSYAASNAATLASGPNPVYVSDPGFIDFANDDLRLRPDAAAYSDMPDFVPIPMEMIGLYNDEYRGDATVRKPFIVTGSASSVVTNAATFTGTLVYPQFDASATVRVYWGTSDGGTNPAAWQNSASLGQPGSGHVAHTISDLAASTLYYFRFHAENTAGGHWAEQSQSFTTMPLQAAPAGGIATADSAATPASLAFDGNPATFWQTAGTGTGTLTYQFADNAAVVVTRYTVTSAPDHPARDPRDWQFLGSNDGANWFVLDSRSGQTFSARGQTLGYGFSNTTAFRFHRLVVTANQGDATGLQIAELGLYTPGIPGMDLTPPVISVPAEITVETMDIQGTEVTFATSAVDNVDGSVATVSSPASGSIFPPGTTHVMVTATDLAGNASSSSFAVTVVLVPPAAPSGLSATVLSETQVRLNWTDNATQEDSYSVERSPAGASQWTTLTANLPPGTTSFTDAAAVPSSAFDYRVRCAGTSGFSGYDLTSVTLPPGIGDGIPGWWRLLHFGNGLAVIPGTSGPADDPDGDGSANLAEFAAGTDPNAPASVFKVTAFTLSGGNALLTFSSVPGRVYQVEACQDLHAGNWTLVGDPVQASGTTLQATVPLQPPAGTGWFFRVRCGP